MFEPVEGGVDGWVGFIFDDKLQDVDLLCAILLVPWKEAGYGELLQLRETLGGLPCQAEEPVQHRLEDQQEFLPGQVPPMLEVKYHHQDCVKWGLHWNFFL